MEIVLIDKNKLIKELELCVDGCEHCEWSKDGWNCTKGFQFASACESICEAVEIDEEDIVANYCKKYNINQIRVGDRGFVEVVRCKDCKYSVDYYQDGNCYCRKPSKPMEWIEKGFNWFCADGERRTE